MAARGEDNALGKMVREAEARRATRQQVRDEARAIRSREIERQRREEEEEEAGCSPSVGPARTFSRRSSSQSTATTGDSAEAGGGGGSSRLADLRQQLSTLDERYKEAMIANAQLDNEKQSLRYEVYLLKDKTEDLEEENAELHRLSAERKREISYQRLQLEEARHQTAFLERQIAARDRLIEEAGLVLVGDASGGAEGRQNGEVAADGEAGSGIVSGMAAVSAELAQRLESLPPGPLEQRLLTLFEARDSLAADVQRLEERMEEERQRMEAALRNDSRRAPADAQVVEMQREASRQINEQKFKFQQAQQKVNALEGDGKKLEEKIIRLEGQVKRYKVIADTCERQEEELKAEKRKLQRDLRDAHNRIEDLKTDNNSLSRKLEKLSRGAAGSMQLAAKTHNLSSNA